MKLNQSILGAMVREAIIEATHGRYKREQTQGVDSFREAQIILETIRAHGFTFEHRDN